MRVKIKYEYIATRVMEVEVDSIEEARDVFVEDDDTRILKDYEIDGQRTCIEDIEEMDQ